MEMFVKELLRFFALQAGTVPAPEQIVYSAPPAVRHQAVRPRKAKPAVAVLLPKARPAGITQEFVLRGAVVEAALSPAPSIVSVPPPPAAIQDPAPFKWTGRYALPPAWVQLWTYVG